MGKQKNGIKTENWEKRINGKRKNGKEKNAKKEMGKEKNGKIFKKRKNGKI